MENKVLIKFSRKSVFFSAIAEQTAPEVAHNILKNAHIHDILKNRTIVQKGQDIDNIMVMLKGKFAISDSNEIAKEEGDK